MQVKRGNAMRVALRPAPVLQAIAMVGLLGVSACGSLPVVGRAETDSSLRLAGIFLNAGAPEAALHAADEALVRQPRNREAMVLRADALAALDQTEEAQQAYLAAIAEDPKAVAPRIALGRLLVRGGNAAAAEAMFTDVLSRQPTNAIALNNLGIARDLQGKHREAQPAYRAARLADPKMSGASVNLGLSLVLSGDMAAAVQELSPLAAAPDAPPAVLENLGVALAAGGQPVEAARVLARVMSPGEVTQTLAQYRNAPRVAMAPPAPVAAAPAPVAVAAAPAPAPLALAPAAATVSNLSVSAVAPVRQAAPAAPVAAAPVAAAPVAAAPVAVAPAPAVVEAPVSLPVTTAPPPAPVQAESLPAPVAAPVPAAPAVPVAEPVAAVAPAESPAAQGPRAVVTGVPVAVPVAPGVPAARSRGAYAQLAASDTEQGAPAEWMRLQRRLGGLLRDRETVTLAADVGGRTVWRLRTPFQSTTEAVSFCAEVRAAGGHCWAVSGG